MVEGLLALLDAACHRHAAHAQRRQAHAHAEAGAALFAAVGAAVLQGLVLSLPVPLVPTSILTWSAASCAPARVVSAPLLTVRVLLAVIAIELIAARAISKGAAGRFDT